MSGEAEATPPTIRLPHRRRRHRSAQQAHPSEASPATPGQPQRGQQQRELVFGGSPIARPAPARPPSTSVLSGLLDHVIEEISTVLSAEKQSQLAAAAAHHPRGVLNFLEITTILAAGVSCLLTILTSVWMWMMWQSWSSCGWFLRFWHVANTSLQALQSVARIMVLLYIDKASCIPLGHAVAAFIQELVCGRLWKSMAIMAIASYALISVGFLWSLTTSDRRCLPHLPWMKSVMGGTFLLAFLRVLITHWLLHNLNDELERRAASRQPHGATPEQVAALPLCRFSSGTASLAPTASAASTGDSGSDVGLDSVTACSDANGGAEFQEFQDFQDQDKCAVCLMDFLEGDTLRQLPCRHLFHSGCIEPWLLKNKRCPLCISPIDLMRVMDPWDWRWLFRRKPS